MVGWPAVWQTNLGDARNITPPDWFNPPDWLPEGIAKLPVFGHLFERADSVKLPRLTARDFELLSQLPTLRHLAIMRFDNDRSVLEIDRIDRLQSLESVTLDNIQQFDTAGLGALSDLPNLKYLHIDGSAFDDAMVDQVNQLQSVEELEIERSRCGQIHLHGL